MRSEASRTVLGRDNLEASLMGDPQMVRATRRGRSRGSGCGRLFEQRREHAAGDAGDAGGFARCSMRAISVAGTTAARSGGGFDGTTGKACTQTPTASAPTGRSESIRAASTQRRCSRWRQPSRWATPVCLIPPSVDRAGQLRSRAGRRGRRASPLLRRSRRPDVARPICVPFDQNNPQPGQGSCYPLCTFGLDGQKPTGCAGTELVFPGHVPAEHPRRRP